jgi:hypothetical protein
MAKHPTLKMISVWLGLFFAILLLASACSTARTPQATPLPTYTPRPTYTLYPTATAVPTIDIEATVEALVAERLKEIDPAYVQPPTRTPIPSPTPTLVPQRTPRFNFAPVPTLTPTRLPTLTPTPAGPARGCCKYCKQGKACGNVCISRSQTCYVRKGVGCACNAALPGLPSQPSESVLTFSPKPQLENPLFARPVFWVGDFRNYGVSRSDACRVSNLDPYFNPGRWNSHGGIPRPNPY